jgi:quercetin dioxygenase-like cupin family protein
VIERPSQPKASLSYEKQAVVWFEPGEKHWHGAAPTTAMTYIAIVEQLAGAGTEWMEMVSDRQYQA